jgi:hypothetical protein
VEGKLKYFYIAGVAISGDYDENFEKIIKADSEKKAIKRLAKQLYEFDDINIDQLYETTSDARI